MDPSAPVSPPTAASDVPVDAGPGIVDEVIDDNLVRIGELSRRTGVSDHTLRAWEHRYGLLRPHRTTGGFRLYSAADERRIRWMTALLNSGMSPAEAARVVLHHRDDDTIVLSSPGRTMMPGRAASTNPEVDYGPPTVGFTVQPPTGITGMWGRVGPTDPTLDAPTTGAAADALATLATELHGALVRFDELAAHDAIDHAMSYFSLPATVRSVLVPTIDRLAEEAASGSGSPHLGYAAHVLRGRLGGLTRGCSAGVGPLAVVAALDGPWSELLVLSAAVVLHRAGWRVINAGGELPTAAALAADGLNPDLVYVRAAAPDAFERKRSEISDLARRGTIVVTGAGATPDFARATGAVFAGGELVTEVARIARVSALTRAATTPVPAT
ncbi:MAG TPA: MerR family transcriptional regulator [Dermatophilaceae bacterium]|nr:MerR family transcriptional regulator [Dermatophilaceae bacterium]